ncbi:RICIN domain-containing protein [Actinomadura litoris]|uniref:RICIN domain-containing protein n=1 Tax=Actinomadura litoris TaxID=2678616 RepID=UPI001FA7E803|nr:RICIN domain-containing protein [Actinomadura litoris]
MRRHPARTEGTPHATPDHPSPGGVGGRRRARRPHPDRCPPASALAAVPVQTWTVSNPADGVLANHGVHGCLSATLPYETTRIWQCKGPNLEAQRIRIQPQAIISLYSKTQGYCLTATSSDMPTILYPCNGSPEQRFVYDGATKTVRNLASGLCLTATGANQPTYTRTCV